MVAVVHVAVSFHVISSFLGRTIIRNMHVARQSRQAQHPPLGGEYLLEKDGYYNDQITSIITQSYLYVYVITRVLFRMIVHYY